MSGVGRSDHDVDIDLGGIVSAIWERKFRLIAAAAVAGALALVVASLMTPSYRGETRLLIESRSPNFGGASAPVQANDPVLDALNITSQAQLLQSSDLIKRVARETKLAEREEFDPAAQSLLPNPLVLIGLKQDPMTLEPEDRVIEIFRDKLHVYAVENSRVIAIEFSSHDPRLAADIPNRMADVYLETQSGAKLDTHSEAVKWLEPEIANLTRNVQEAEKKVAEYRSSNGLFQTAEANSFSTRQLSDISTELARVRGERANAEARAENVRAALRAGRASDGLADVVGSQVIQRLKEAEANLQAQISDQSTTLLEGHPRLRGLRAQLNGIRQQIESETRKILASLESEAEVSRLRERQLMAQLNGLKADSAKAGEEEVGLRALEREAAAQRQLLETYLARYREATSRLEANSTPADARIVSRAVEPSQPYFPKIIPIVIVASLATFIFGCLIIVIAELFSGRALRPSGLRSTPEEDMLPKNDVVAATTQVPSADQTTGAPVHYQEPEPPVEPIAADAENTVDDDIEAQAVAEDSTANGFTIASVASYLIRQNVSVAIGVSPGGDNGSTVTVALARAIAGERRSVVLVDLTGSACPTSLMTEAGLPGITDLLCGETPFGDAIHHDRLSDAHIVPHGVSDPSLAMRNVDRLKVIVDALADAYDIVLIECGPAEIRSLSRLMQAQTAEIVLSVPGFSEEEVAKVVTDFDAAGYRNLLVMNTAEGGVPPYPSSRRAA